MKRQQGLGLAAARPTRAAFHPRAAAGAGLVRGGGPVFERTGNCHENDAPDAPAPGVPAKPDCRGWTATVPLALTRRLLR